MKRFAMPVLVALVPLALLLAAVLKKTGMNFTYTLDDPYIHLALARNILLGNYGINLSEPSAPSSSILWPFLLVPFAKLPLVWFEYVPLVLNAVCVLLSAVVLDKIFAERPPLARVVLSFSILLATNIYGLVFSGMEHNLQVLLVLYLTYGLLDRSVLQPGSSGYSLFLGCVLLLPLVRYEGAAFSFPVLAYLFFTGRCKGALLAGVPLVLIMAGFSLYLNSRGVGYVPSSILAKSYYPSSFAVVDNLRVNLEKYGFLLLPIAWICQRHFEEDRAFALLLPAIALLHFVFGKYGWFGRYEVYFVIFIAVITLRELLAFAPRMWWLALSLPLVFNSLLYATVFTPLAASNIASQQRLMATIARELGGSVAVNDIGLVALESSQYVLDLMGLGSLEALAARRRNEVDAEWIKRLMARNGVEYAIVYPEMYPEKPGNWIRVGDLTLNQARINVPPYLSLVTFFATTVESQERLRAALREFAEKHDSPAYSLTIH
jgi:hypothetical protein